jgi:hypothetical protein
MDWLGVAPRSFRGVHGAVAEPSGHRDDHTRISAGSRANRCAFV